MSDGKACTFCGVGWMTLSIVRDLFGRAWRVWHCNACDHADREPAE